MYISNRTPSEASPGPVPLLGHVDVTCEENTALLADLDWEEGISIFNQIAVIDDQRQGGLPNLALAATTAAACPCARLMTCLGASRQNLRSPCASRPVEEQVFSAVGALYDRDTSKRALPVYTPGSTQHRPELLRVLWRHAMDAEMGAMPRNHLAANGTPIRSLSETALLSPQSVLGRWPLKPERLERFNLLR